jgi:hypothetical protein
MSKQWDERLQEEMAVTHALRTAVRVLKEDRDKLQDALRAVIRELNWRWQLDAQFPIPITVVHNAKKALEESEQ